MSHTHRTLSLYAMSGFVNFSRTEWHSAALCSASERKITSFNKTQLCCNQTSLSLMLNVPSFTLDVTYSQC